MRNNPETSTITKKYAIKTLVINFETTNNFIRWNKTMPLGESNINFPENIFIILPWICCVLSYVINQDIYQLTNAISE